VILRFTKGFAKVVNIALGVGKGRQFCFGGYAKVGNVVFGVSEYLKVENP
jgi:hypothetical protein